MDLEKLRQQKLAALQARMSGLQRQERLAQQLEMLEAAVRAKLTREALARYGALKTAHPDKAIALLAVLARMLEKVDVIDDAMLRKILEQLAPPKRATTIRRV